MSYTPPHAGSLEDIYHQFDVLQGQGDRKSQFTYFTVRNITNTLQSQIAPVTVKRQIISEIVDTAPGLLKNDQTNAFELFINTMVSCVHDPDMQVGNPIERRGVPLAVAKSGNLALVALSEIVTKIEDSYPEQSQSVRVKLGSCSVR